VSTAGLAGITTNNEYAVINAAVLAELLGCRSLAPETAIRFRDKRVQKQVVAARGIATARSILLEDVLDVASLEMPFERAVLKPAAGAATRMTRLVRSLDDLQSFAKKYQRHRGIPRTFVLEEFQPGDEWLVDGTVYGGEVAFYSVARYGRPCLETLRAGKGLRIRRFDPESEKWAFATAEPVVRGALSALGLRDGVFHMELFHRDGEISFGEVGARRGGAFVHQEIEHKFGVDLGDAAHCAALGEPPCVETAVRPEVVGGTYLTAPEGLLYSAPGESEIASRPGVVHAEMEFPVGASLTGPGNDTTGRIGQVLLSAASVEEFDRLADDVCAWFAERIVMIPPDATKRELRALSERLGAVASGVSG
jgi:biotin carboxylase